MGFVLREWDGPVMTQPSDEIATTAASLLENVLQNRDFLRGQPQIKGL